MGFATWLALATTFTIAAIAPGPDFFAVLKTSLARGHRHGIAVAAGIAAGLVLWTLASLFGIVAIISTSPTAYLITRACGAVFLTVYGARIIIAALREAGNPSAPPSSLPAPAHSYWQAWRLGFLTNTLGNPKALVFFTSLFATLIPPHVTAIEAALIIATSSGIGFLWFSLLAYLASRASLIRLYTRAKRSIDVLLGCAFTLLGLALFPWETLPFFK